MEMARQFNLQIIIFTSLSLYSLAANKNLLTKISQASTILKIEMVFEPFGVEADNYPTIHSTLDFKANTGLCKVEYLSLTPKKSKRYSLTPKEMKTVQGLLKKMDLNMVQKKYSSDAPDEPTSYMTIYTSLGKFGISDHGLVGDSPLQEIYKIVYKLNQNIR